MHLSTCLNHTFEALKGEFVAGDKLAHLHWAKDIPILSIAIEFVELIYSEVLTRSRALKLSAQK